MSPVLWPSRIKTRYGKACDVHSTIAMEEEESKEDHFKISNSRLRPFMVKREGETDIASIGNPEEGDEMRQSQGKIGPKNSLLRPSKVKKGFGDAHDVQSIAATARAQGIGVEDSAAPESGDGGEDGINEDDVANVTGTTMTAGSELKHAETVARRRRRQEDATSQMKKDSHHIRKRLELNSVQRAGLNAYMVAVRSGQATLADWESLVHLMKGDNLALFEGTLGRMLQSMGCRDDGDDYDGDVGTGEAASCILGGGRSGICTSGEAAVGSVAIDPTDFYRYLSSDDVTPIDTNNVGDAAIVFRSLICCWNIR